VTRRLPDTLELGDDALRLRPWSADDVDDLTRIWQDRELQLRFDVDSPVTRGAVSAYVDGVRARWQDGLQVSLAVVVDGALVGGCDLDHLDTDRPDLGYWLAPDARGHGDATRAGALLLAWAEHQLGCSRVCLEVEADNAPSIAVAARLGFVRAHGVERTVDDRRLRVYQLTISR
jgi:RimJ/RimL family protein N-acetyltransferase